MKIAGNYNFAAPREEVWAAINDPEVLARALPGCEKLEQISENEFETTLNIRLQAVRGTYSGRVRIEDAQPPAHYRIFIDGKGNNGFLKGEGSIDLREEAVAMTIIDYGGEAQVGGTIASVGQRLIDGAAKTLINQSLKALAAQIEARYQASSSEQDGLESPPPAPPSTVTPAPEAAPAAVAPAELPTRAPVAPSQPQPQPTPERYTIHVPESERLSESQMMRGMLDDFFKDRPWLPWVIVAFLLGFLFGRRG